MKNFSVLIFLFLSTCAFSQIDIKINILGSLDYSFLKDFDREYSFDPSFDYKAPLGTSFDISLEFGNGQASSFQTGIRYSKKNYYPDFEITLYYGGRLSFEGDSLWVQLPSLTRLQYQTISIPVSHKYYFGKGKPLSFYMLAGVIASFRISKEESFEDVYFDAESDDEVNKISARDQKIKLFNTAIEIGGGMNFKIREDVAILFQVHAHLLDFRKADDQLMDIWPQIFENRKLWWKDTFLPIGQVSIGIGLQRFF